MKLQNLMKGILVFACVSVTALSGFTYVGAENDFEANEREYINKCSSTNLSKSDIEVCEQFNQYLRNKNSEIQSNLAQVEEDLSSTQAQITAVHEEIEVLNTQIAEKEETISYVQSQITQQEESIAEKETMLEDRLYAMQGYVNSHQLIDFVLGATDFSDLFSRIQGVNELTAYDKELITELNDTKAQLEETKQWAEEEKANLVTAQNEQVAKQEEMNQLIETYTAQIEAGEAEMAENEVIYAELDAAISQSRITEEQQDWINNGGPSSGGAPVTGNGSSVVAYATSKVGSAYVWGATGPNAFDCSGLTSWAYAQVGVSIGRTTYAQYGNGMAVAYSELQPGDLVFFNTGGYCSHVGMYVGGGVMVHAGTPATGVEYTNLNSSYWQGVYLGARRYI